MARFCSECGSQLSDDARFCNNCGTPCVQADPAPQSSAYREEPTAQAPYLQPGPQPMQQPMYQQPAYQQPNYQQPIQQQPSYQPVSQPRPQPRYAAPVAGAQQPYAQYVPLNTPEQKSHMGLGIGVTVAIVIGAILIITGIVLFIVFNPFGWGGMSKDALVEKLICAHLTDKYDADDILDNVYEYQFSKSESEKQDLREDVERYTIASAGDIEELKEVFGKDYTVSVTNSDTQTLSGGSYDDFIASCAEKYSKGIDELVRVNFEYTIKGSEGSEQDSSIVVLCKAGGKWYYVTSY